jgi:hypothetical protein
MSCTLTDTIGEIRTGPVLEVLDEVGCARIVERVFDTAAGARLVENRLRVVALRV